jgi:hypothetical protein
MRTGHSIESNVRNRRQLPDVANFTLKALHLAATNTTSECLSPFDRRRGTSGVKLSQRTAKLIPGTFKPRIKRARAGETGPTPH